MASFQRDGYERVRAHALRNARPFVVFALLKRFLEHEGLEVTLVENITDVNDKIYAARADAVPSEELAGEMTARYIELTHAVIDALLGAAGLGDIGPHFPDTDERWRDAGSIALLGEVCGLLDDAGCTVLHVDFTVICQGPRLGPYRDAIRGRLSEAIGIQPLAVNLRFTANEGHGILGRAEGIAALASATVERAEHRWHAAAVRGPAK